MTCDDAPVSTPDRLPLRRPEHGRVVGGVAAGLAAHLGLPVGLVRLALVVTVPLAGMGAVLYVFWWVTIPSGDPTAAAEAQRPAAMTRLAPRLRLTSGRLPLTDIGLGLLLLVGAGVLIAWRQGVDLGATWLVPALIVLGGAGLAWSQLDAVQRDRAAGRPGGRTPVSVLRLVGGTVLAGAGVFLLVGWEAPLEDLVRSAVAALAVLVGAGLVLAPWWLRLVRELGDERAARARESERADIAAHLHDSVLQTLALIRSRSTESDTVARLARAQERELRAWLYDDRPTPGTSLAAELREVVAEVEDTRGVAVELVVVGDQVPDQDSETLLRATREALLNATAHGEPPVSVYFEAGPELVEVFVRDHGDGFDLDDVPPDRFGGRESIVGRMRRRGGTASVTCRPRRTAGHLRLAAGDAARATKER